MAISAGYYGGNLAISGGYENPLYQIELDLRLYFVQRITIFSLQTKWYSIKPYKLSDTVLSLTD